MGLPTAAIQTALIARYRGDVTLQNLLGNPTNPPGAIFDAEGVPTSQVFPYVVVYPISSQQGTAIAMGLDSVDTYVQVSTLTQTGASGGFGQARGIAAQIYELTQTKPLNLTASGFQQFFLMFDNEQELPGQDGITQQIVHRYHLKTQG